MIDTFFSLMARADYEATTAHVGVGIRHDYRSGFPNFEALYVVVFKTCFDTPDESSFTNSFKQSFGNIPFEGPLRQVEEFGTRAES